MVRILVALFLWALAGLAAAQSPGQGTSTARVPSNVAGKVDLVEGDVTVYDRAKVGRKVRVGESLYEGEGVVTGRDGELHVAMDDGGYLAIRPNTNMSILAYQAQGREDDRSILNLVAGSFRSITGWVGRYNPKAYQVRTPTATIGIRGTDHEPMVIPEHAPNGEAGTYDKVNAGGTYIESVRGYGRVDVTPNRAGFAPLKGRPVPRLLAEVPRFYRPTRNEQRLFNKHQAAQQSLDRLRNERRRAIDERRKALDERKADKREREQRREPEKEMRRKDVEQRREQQQQERLQRAEERRQKSEEHGRPKAEIRKRDNRGEAPRGRQRD